MGELDVALGEIAQSIAPHQGEIDRRRQRAERMVGADIRGRPLAPDVLLASRERKCEGAPPIGIAGFADQPARHLTDLRHRGGHEAQTWPAELHRDAETLRLADHDIGAERAWRLEDRERQRLGGRGDRDSAGAMGYRCDLLKRLDRAEGVGVSGHGAEQAIVGRALQRLQIRHAA